MTCVEERLAGGRNAGAWRAGDTVRKPVDDETPAVHALLHHLELHGFTGAPRALGVDDEGRQVLSFLAGETVGTTRPWPSWTHSDDALVAVGAWLREFHDVVRSFVPPPDALWFHKKTLDPGEVVGHHDAAPYNAVWSDGGLVGFVDWDLAHPGLPVEDLAFVALTWVPLTARDVAAGDGFPTTVDRGARLRALLAAYGWEGTVGEVLDAVRQRAADHATGLRAAAADGYPPAVDLVAEGVADAFDRAVEELDEDRTELLRAAAG